MRAEDDGDLESAIASYHEALLTGGPDAEICFNFGNALYGLDRAGEAAQRFMQAAEIEPDYVEAWNNLGNVLAELEQFDASVRAFERAIAVGPTYADAHFNLAQTFEILGRSGDACEHWNACLRQDPNSTEADYVRARLAAHASGGH